jgi:DNA-damage-inducible protein J
MGAVTCHNWADGNTHVLDLTRCIDNMHTLSYIYDEVMTMPKTANLNIRIDPETKSGAEQLFASFGITVTDAINIFLHQSLMVGGLPFEMKRPRFNAATEAAMREARAIVSGKISAKEYSSAKDLFAELDAEC